MEVSTIAKIKTEDLEEWKEKVALFRHGVIAPMLYDACDGDASLREYARNAAQKTVEFPDGTTGTVPAKTILRWYYDFKAGGMNALKPKDRADRGTFRTLSPDMQKRIQELRTEFPKLSGSVLREKMIEEQSLPPGVGLRTVQRYIKTLKMENPLPGELKDRKAYEAPLPGDFWLADTKYLLKIKVDGKDRQVYLMVIEDDCSRMIVGADLYLNDNGENFLCLLKRAVADHGICRKLYADHGGPYDNQQLRWICADLGIDLRHAPVRDGAAKGKVERLHKTVQERLMFALHPEEIDGLEDYRGRLREEVFRYNRQVHSTTGEAPFLRFEAHLDTIRRPRSQEWLDQCFERRLTRTVHKDSTFTVNKVWYEAPPQFAGQKVELHYQVEEPDVFTLVHNGNRYKTQKLDRHANFATPRKQTLTLDYRMEVPTDK